MGKKIETFKDLIQSKRFKNVVKREFNAIELELVNELFVYIKDNDDDLFTNTGTYSIFSALVSYDLNNLLERFKFIKNNATLRSERSYNARYGATEGKARWMKYCEKQRYKNTFEAKQKKYGWTKDQFDQYNKSRAITEENLIKKYGEVEGKDRWDNYCRRQAYTNSIDYFIEKYGEDGRSKWEEYNTEKGKSFQLWWIMKKNNVDEDAASLILSERHNVPDYCSDSEKEFVRLLEQALNEKIKYTVNTRQFCIWNEYLNTSCFYDVTCTNRNKIIEFNGDYWHCNPERYDKTYLHQHLGKTAKEIWDRDYLKKKAALDRGFEIKVVWWSDFRANQAKVIEECVKWLNKK